MKRENFTIEVSSNGKPAREIEDRYFLVDNEGSILMRIRNSQMMEGDKAEVWVKLGDTEIGHGELGSYCHLDVPITARSGSIGLITASKQLSFVFDTEAGLKKRGVDLRLPRQHSSY